MSTVSAPDLAETPVDDLLTLTAALVADAVHDVALVASNRTTVLARAQWVSQRAKRLTRGICGQRSLFLRVTPRGAPGQVRLTVSVP